MLTAYKFCSLEYIEHMLWSVIDRLGPYGLLANLQH